MKHLDFCEEDDGDEGNEKLVWRREDRPLNKDEVLEVSPGCYDMLHTVSLDWSCLSFDIIRDDLGAHRTQFPHVCHLVSGTQPGKNPEKNAAIHVMKWSNIVMNEADGEIEDDEAPTNGSCQLVSNTIRHPGIVNRIKCCPQSHRLVCTMSDSSKVHIWDIDEQWKGLNNKHSLPTSSQTPIYTSAAHGEEGYALGWNPNVLGLLATGACNGTVILWNPAEAGWNTSNFFKASSSVEDIGWRTAEENVFAAAYCDGYFRLHDIRAGTEPQGSILFCKDSITDVNSLAWNPNQNTLLLVGDESGSCKVFDIRFLESHVAKLSWHREAITCVGWHPTDSAVCASSSRDDSISIWDLSVEPQNVDDHNNKQNLPQQLMFLHMGQTEITELMFHPQIPGVIISTAVDGFNIFKCTNID